MGGALHGEERHRPVAVPVLQEGTDGFAAHRVWRKGKGGSDEAVGWDGRVPPCAGKNEKEKQKPPRATRGTEPLWTRMKKRR